MSLTPILVTFSGPEGAGKSTHRDLALAYARERGLRVHLVKANRVGVSTWLLELADRLGIRKLRPRTYTPGSLAPGGAGAPLASEAPAGRAGWTDYRRIVTYAIDCCLLRVRFLLERGRGADVVLCDRYVYDALVKLVDHHPGAVRGLRRLMLRPARAFLITADPEICAARRQTSSVEYFEQRLRQFERLNELCPELVRVHSADLVEAEAHIRDALRPILVG